MAFPYLLEANFESGDNSEFTSETDTGSALDFPHYSTLAKIPQAPMPFRGAYCMRATLGGTADAFVTSTDISIAASATEYSGWWLYIGSDTAATVQDVVNIFELQTTGGAAVETAVGLRFNTDGTVEVGIGETAPTVWVDLSKGRWHHIGVGATVDSGAGNDGTSTLYVNGISAGSVATLDQGAVAQGVLGIQDQLATTTGTLYFDDFIQDDAQVIPERVRKPTDFLLTKSGHVFVGNGKVSNVTLIAGSATDNTLEVYDTDTAYTTGEEFKARLANTANNEIVDPAGMPVQVSNGFYVALGGTNPRALVQVKCALTSDGAIRDFGQRRKADALRG